MLEFVFAALAFGFSAGLKPGPLGVYVIHQTLHRGYLNGLTASLAPFVSDGPMIVLSFLLLQQFQHVPVLLAGIAFTGACYLLYLAWRMFHTHHQQQATQDEPSSFFTAVKINLLNPVAWMFWMTVGGFYLVKGSTEQAVAFVVFMLGTLALIKFLFAASIRLLGKGLSSQHLSAISKLLSLILVGFAIKLTLDGVAYLIG